MNERRSTLGARVSGRRAGQRFDSEHGVVTEALLFLGDLDPEAIGPSLAHATHYEPTPVGDFEPLLAAVPFALERSTFVDVGAGMGRALLLAARHPFRQCVGVEISPALCEVARENVARIATADLLCRDLRIVRADAATYRFPRGNLVVYLYNPFGAAILACVLERLTGAFAREIAVIYHTPVWRDVIEAHPAFELVAENPAGVVYRLVPRSGETPGRSSRRTERTSANDAAAGSNLCARNRAVRGGLDGAHDPERLEQLEQSQNPERRASARYDDLKTRAYGLPKADEDADGAAIEIRTLVQDDDQPLGTAVVGATDRVSESTARADVYFALDAKNGRATARGVDCERRHGVLG